MTMTKETVPVARTDAQYNALCRAADRGNRVHACVERTGTRWRVKVDTIYAAPAFQVSQERFEGVRELAGRLLETGEIKGHNHGLALSPSEGVMYLYLGPFRDPERAQEVTAEVLAIIDA